MPIFKIFLTNCKDVLRYGPTKEQALLEAYKDIERSNARKLKKYEMPIRIIKVEEQD